MYKITGMFWKSTSSSHLQYTTNVQLLWHDFLLSSEDHSLSSLKIPSHNGHCVGNKQQVFAYTREGTPRKCMVFNCITLILNVSMKSLPRNCIDNPNPLTGATRASVINVRFSNAMNRHIRSKIKLRARPFPFCTRSFSR